MTLRDRFEARYPCPEVVGFNEELGVYYPAGDSLSLSKQQWWVRCDIAESLNKRWEAYQAAMEDAVPEGWAVVPNKPTPDMLEACNQVLSDQAVKHGYSPETFDATLAVSMYWKAMLSSIPTPDSTNE